MTNPQSRCLSALRSPVALRLVELLKRRFCLLIVPLAFLVIYQCTIFPRVEASSAADKRGAELFATRGCAHCHGAAGIGGRLGPDLSNVRRRLKDSAIILQIQRGGKVMPPFGEILSASEISDLVAYLRSKRTAPRPSQVSSSNPRHKPRPTNPLDAD
jgi:mono/diheme cytochrome c family protein